MGTAYSTLITDLRQEIREPSANQWEDSQLARYLSNAEQWLAQVMSRIRGSGRFHRQEGITLAAETEIFDLTSLAKPYTAIHWIEMLIANNVWQPVYERQMGDDNLNRWPTTTPASPWVVPDYELIEDTLSFLPTVTAARTMRLAYQWLPEVKGVGGTAETPVQYDDILVKRAAFDALGIQGESETTFEQKYATRLGEIESFEWGRVNQGTGRTVINRNSRSLFPG